MLESKNTVTEKKSAFDGLSSGLDTAEEKISKHQDTSVETSKTKKEKRTSPRPPKNGTEYLRTVGQLQKA